MKITNSNDVNRTIEVTVDQSGKVLIGYGRNTDYPRLDVHPDDIDTLVNLIRKVTQTKLPNPTQ